MPKKIVKAGGADEKALVVARPRMKLPILLEREKNLVLGLASAVKEDLSGLVRWAVGAEQPETESHIRHNKNAEIVLAAMTSDMPEDHFLDLFLYRLPTLDMDKLSETNRTMVGGLNEKAVAIFTADPLAFTRKCFALLKRRDPSDWFKGGNGANKLLGENSQIFIGMLLNFAGRFDGLSADEKAFFKDLSSFMRSSADDAVFNHYAIQHAKGSDSKLVMSGEVTFTFWTGLMSSNNTGLREFIREEVKKAVDPVAFKRFLAATIQRNRAEQLFVEGKAVVDAVQAASGGGGAKGVMEAASNAWERHEEAVATHLQVNGGKRLEGNELQGWSIYAATKQLPLQAIFADSIAAERAASLLSKFAYAVGSDASIFGDLKESVKAVGKSAAKTGEMVWKTGFVKGGGQAKLLGGLFGTAANALTNRVKFGKDIQDMKDKWGEALSLPGELWSLFDVCCHLKENITETKWREEGEKLLSLYNHTTQGSSDEALVVLENVNGLLSSEFVRDQIKAASLVIVKRLVEETRQKAMKKGAAAVDAAAGFLKGFVTTTVLDGVLASVAGTALAATGVGLGGFMVGPMAAFAVVGAYKELDDSTYQDMHGAVKGALEKAAQAAGSVAGKLGAGMSSLYQNTTGTDLFDDVVGFIESRLKIRVDAVMDQALEGIQGSLENAREESKLANERYDAYYSHRSALEAPTPASYQQIEDTAIATDLGVEFRPAIKDRETATEEKAVADAQAVLDAQALAKKENEAATVIQKIPRGSFVRTGMTLAEEAAKPAPVQGMFGRLGSFVSEALPGQAKRKADPDMVERLKSQRARKEQTAKVTAATTVQALARGVLVRQKMMEVKTAAAKVAQEAAEQAVAEAKAATIVQRTYKGHTGRVAEAKQREEAAKAVAAAAKAVEQAAAAKVAQEAAAKAAAAKAAEQAAAAKVKAEEARNKVEIPAAAILQRAYRGHQVKAAAQAAAAEKAREEIAVRAGSKAKHERVSRRLDEPEEQQKEVPAISAPLAQQIAAAAGSVRMPITREGLEAAKVALKKPRGKKGAQAKQVVEVLEEQPSLVDQAVAAAAAVPVSADTADGSGRVSMTAEELATAKAAFEGRREEKAAQAAAVHAPLVDETAAAAAAAPSSAVDPAKLERLRQKVERKRQERDEKFSSDLAPAHAVLKKADADAGEIVAAVQPTVEEISRKTAARKKRTEEGTALAANMSVPAGGSGSSPVDPEAVAKKVASFKQAQTAYAEAEKACDSNNRSSLVLAGAGFPVAAALAVFSTILLTNAFLAAGSAAVITAVLSTNVMAVAVGVVALLILAVASWGANSYRTRETNKPKALETYKQFGVLGSSEEKALGNSADENAAAGVNAV